MFSLVRIRPTFEQEAPKWLWKLFDDADSNTIRVGSQRGYTMIQKRQPPNELGTLPIKWVSTAMFSLVRIRPMFEQEAPKWPYCLRLDSNTIISRIHLQVTMWSCNGNNTFTFGGEKGHMSCFIAYRNIYMAYRNMYITRAGGSSVIRPKLSYVPRPTGLLLRLAWIFVLPNVDKVVWPVVQVLADHKGPFPRRG